MVILAVRFLSEQPTVQEIIQRPDRAGKCLFCVYCCLKFSDSRLFEVSFFVAKYGKIVN